ncbi:MAG: helix-turn-helix domain-containing protein [Treponema sp.]
MEDFFDTFRMNMKFYREQLGMSQAELAVQSDSSNGMIGNIESGKAKPSFDSIVRIAAALKIHPADLFLRNASQTVNNTRKILQTELITNIQDFILRKF